MNRSKQDAPHICPRCKQPATVDHFRASPECGEAAMRIAGMFRASKRTAPPKPGPGRGHKRETTEGERK